MCGPSSAEKALNNTIQSFASTVESQAKQVFGAVSGLFNSVTASLGKIVAAGQGQQGWGAPETSAVNSQIVNNAATSARNEKSAVGNAVSAIGGGNTVSPSGLATAVNLQTNQAVEATKSQQEEQATVANYQQGNQNYFAAINGEEAAPNMFNAATNATNAANDANKEAVSSQQMIDSQANWWQPLAAAAIGAAGSVGAAAISNSGGGDTPMQVTPEYNSGIPQGSFPGSLPADSGSTPDSWQTILQ